MSVLGSASVTPSLTSHHQSSKSRFPRLQECAHFHYEVSTVDIPKNFEVIMCVESEQSEKPNVNNGTSSLSTTPTSTNASTPHSNGSNSESNVWFHLQVTSNDKKWIIYRTYENFRYLDKFLHDCIFDRKFSCLDEPLPLSSMNANEMSASMISTNSSISSSSKQQQQQQQPRINKSSDFFKQLRNQLAIYLTRFCEIAFINPINCGPILNWFEIDNRGNRMFAIDDSPINIPGVAAAVVKKRYVAQGLDEISLDVGNMISVIDMPPSDESVWWRGKKELEVIFLFFFFGRV